MTEAPVRWHSRGANVGRDARARISGIDVLVSARHMRIYALEEEALRVGQGYDIQLHENKCCVERF